MEPEWLLPPPLLLLPVMLLRPPEPRLPATLAAASPTRVTVDSCAAVVPGT